MSATPLLAFQVDGIPDLNHQYYLFPERGITGAIGIIVNQEATLCRVQVTFQGVAAARVTYKSGKHSHTQRYHDPLINASYDLLKHPSGAPLGLGEALQVPAGTHTFPFHILTANNRLASSADFGTGCVSYTLTAMFVLQGDVVLRNTIPLIVKKWTPVNLPQYLIPHEQEDEKMICCLCCADGPVILRARIERTSVVIGGTVDATLRITNRSKKPVTPVLKLMQHTRLGGGHYKYISTEVVKGIGEQVPPGTVDRVWKGSIPVPHDVPNTSVGETNCVEIKHVLTAQAGIPNAFDLKLPFPVMVGMETGVTVSHLAPMMPAELQSQPMQYPPNQYPPWQNPSNQMQPTQYPPNQSQPVSTAPPPQRFEGFAPPHQAQYPHNAVVPVDGQTESQSQNPQSTPDQAAMFQAGSSSSPPPPPQTVY